MRTRSNRAEKLDASQSASPRGHLAPTIVRVPELAPALSAGQVESVDEASGTAVIAFGTSSVTASVASPVSFLVLETAQRTKELVILQREGSHYTVIGALRTSPTPGVDKGNDYCIEAKRLRLIGADELSLTSGAAEIVLRAFGQVETLATTITSRASQVHKLIGRVLRLN